MHRSPLRLYSGRRVRAALSACTVAMLGLACTSERPIQANSASPLTMPMCSPYSDDSGQNHWITSWKVAPSDALITHPISRLTVRQAFAPHWDGDSLRLRLSNRYSSQPVTLENVTIAKELSPGSPAIVPDTSCRLIFNGESRLVLQAGESIVSDPVHYPVRAFERLTISFYAPEFTPQLTRHLNANEVLFMSPPGDYSDDIDGEVFQANPEGYTANTLIIEALEVPAKPQVSSIVAVGDSITDGSDSSTGFVDGESSPMIATDQRYPNHLQRRIDDAGLAFAVANAGIGGNELLSDGWLPQFGPALLKRLDADVLSVTGVSHVLLMIGTNDFGNPQTGPTPSADDLIAGLVEVIERVHAAQLRIVLGTIPPAEGTVTAGLIGDSPIGLMHGTAQARESRDAVNSWIRTQTFSDGIVDFDRCLADPDKPGYLAAEFNSGDNLHPNPAGYAAMAHCVDLDLFRASRSNSH